MLGTKLKPRYSASKLLNILAEDAGVSVETLLEECTFDSINVGICVDCETINDSCEPDADANWCDECCANTVKSALVLAGLV